MSIFQPTAMYFGQPIVAGASYIIRPDTYASSVSIAIPGTQFGSTFGQTSFRSDISGYINGGSSISDQTTTGTPTSDSTVKFGSDGYTTSMQRTASETIGNLSGGASNVAFGSSAFTIEAWFKPNGGNTGSSWTLFAYNNGVGFFGWSNEGYYRWVGQNSSFGEALVDYSTSAPSVGDWHHIAMTRSGNTWYGCIDGFIRGQFSLSGAVGTSVAFSMMGWSGNSSMFSTLFQDFRVTKGVARYTGSTGSTYTVPQSIVTLG
jgi:hypothetical protein